MKIPLPKTIAFGLLLIAGASTSLRGQTTPFVGIDLAGPASPGTVATNADGSLTITGGGTDFTGSSDSGFYFYTTATGLWWDATMQVVSFQGPDNWSKVGLMVRRPSAVGADPAGGDQEIMMLATRTNGFNDINYQYRPVAAAATTAVFPLNILPNFPNRFLRVTRSNELFLLYTSTNGVNWTNVFVEDTRSTANGFDGTAWENPILVGVGITAHNNTSTNAIAIVSNLTVNVHTIVGPTAAGIVTNINGTTNVYAYTEASFNFVATNNALPIGFYPMSYEWTKNGVRVSTNSMGPNYTFLTTPADNNAVISCVARVADTNYSNVSVASGTMTLTTQSGALMYTNGLKNEFFAGASRQDADNNSTAHGAPITLVSAMDSVGGKGPNYSERFSGYFIPPTNANYIFFVASDDDTDVYLSTDTSAANKKLICQETGFSLLDNWLTPGGGGSTSAQKRSDQWSPDGGTTTPYSAGIPLIGGQLYYFETVHHNGGGGDNCGVTFQTVAARQDPNWTFVDGSSSLISAAYTNIVAVTWAGTNISWVTQPVASATVIEGGSTNLIGKAVTDAEMAPSYQWYLNNAPYPGANSTNLLLSGVPITYNNAQVYLVASTFEGGLSITSSVTVLHVNQAVFESGFLLDQRWANQTSLANLEAGNLGTPDFQMAVPEFGVSVDNPNLTANFVRKVSGYFIPTNTGNYVFYTTGDDDNDLFVSSDDTPAHKRLVCQQAGWNNGQLWPWLSVGGGGAVAAQTRSSTWTTNGVTAWSGGVPLVAGQRYYVEQDFHQGGGGANNSANWGILNDPDPAAGTETRFKGNLIGTLAVRCSFVAFSQQPSNATSQVGGYAIFSANGTTDSQNNIGTVRGDEAPQTNKLFFQWYTNGVAVPNANGPTLTLGPLLPGDNGKIVSCQMRALGFTDNSLTPIWSNSLPATLSVTGTAIFEPGYAQNDVWTNLTSRVAVEQGTQARKPNLTYATPKFEGPVGNNAPNNMVQRISGYFVPPTTGNYTFFVNSDDDSDLFLSTDASPANKTIIAQENVWSNPFQWLAAGSGGATATAQKSSATWTPDGVHATNAFGIPLTAGQKYYLEQVHHNGTGGNNMEATYYNIATDTAPVNGEDTRLTNNLIGAYFPLVTSMTFVQQPVNASAVSGGNSVTFSALGTSPSTVIVGTTGDFVPLLSRTNGSVLYQWYKNGVAIPGAASSNYTQVPILPGDNGATYSVSIRSLGYSENGVTPSWSNSLTATLTVVTDTVPPTISYVSTFTNGNQDPIRFIVDVTFNEWMDTATANNILNYTVAGATVTSATLASNHRTVELDLNQMPTLPLNITVNGIKDLSGNSIAANSTAPINPVLLTFTDIGTPGNAASFGTVGVNPAYPSSIWIEATNGFLVSAEGSDIFGVADGFNFGWESKTNDFDVAVRVVSNGHTANAAKAGLMVREDLTAGSRNWSVVNDPASADGIQAPDNSGFGANNIEANMRATNNVGTISWKTNTSTTIPAYPNAWVRIKRTGNVLIGYSSSNMVDWLPLGAYDTTTNANGALPSAVYVGICTTAHNNDSLTNAVPPPPFKYYNTADYADYNSSFVAVNRARLSTTISGTNVIVTWTPAGGHLESSPALSGPGVNWQSLGTSNPATVPIVPGTASQFLRVVTP